MMLSDTAIDVLDPVQMLTSYTFPLRDIINTREMLAALWGKPEKCYYAILIHCSQVIMHQLHYCVTHCCLSVILGPEDTLFQMLLW